MCKGMNGLSLEEYVGQHIFTGKKNMHFVLLKTCLQGNNIDSVQSLQGKSLLNRQTLGNGVGWVLREVKLYSEYWVQTSAAVIQKQ